MGEDGGALPTLVVLGAMKCGTSALHRYLSLHPEVSASDPKELDFFLEGGNWARGLDWYASHFDAGKPARVEASPNYTAYAAQAGVMARMEQVIPTARFVYLVRDPVDRIAAHWVHNVHRARLEPGARMEPILLHPNATYLARSSYGYQVRNFADHFPLNRLLVLDQRELLDRRAATLRRVFEFADVDPSFLDAAFDAPHGRTSRKLAPSLLGRVVRRVGPRACWLRWRDHPWLSAPSPRPDVRRALPEDVLDDLRADAADFSELTGLDVSHWSIWR
ncbi:MAG: sulfotransferase family protein [Sporichthyaceae bacterium]